MRLRPAWVLLAMVSLLLSATSLTVVLWPQLLRPQHPGWHNYLDVLDEANLPTWWSTGLLVMAALAHALVAIIGRRAHAPGASYWFSSGGVLATLSLDDHTQLHERSGRIGRALFTYESFPFYWLVPGAVAGVAVATALLLLAARVHGRTRLLLVTGLGVLLAAALGGETVQGMVMPAASNPVTYALVYHTEELGENLGALLMLASAATAVSVTRHGTRAGGGESLEVGYRAGATGCTCSPAPAR